MAKSAFAGNGLAGDLPSPAGEADGKWLRTSGGAAVWQTAYSVPDPSAQPDGKVLTTASGAATWATGGGGGGGSAKLLGYAVNTTLFTLSTNNTFEDLTGMSITKTATASRVHTIEFSCDWRNSDANWKHHQIMALVDGATTGVQAAAKYLWRQNSNGPTDNYFSQSLSWIITGLSGGSHTWKLQSSDVGGLINREFTYCQMFLYEWDIP